MKALYFLQYHVTFTACPTLATTVPNEPCCIDSK